jgi:LmbE family N-acetylglucosaminyl deacetylase
MLSFSKSDKILIIAPHPDDESLGTGGMLQRIFAQKIPVRILFATNGENNPWAQRYWERRWRIGPVEQVRWGQRRREEALNAICTLGGKPDCARFLNLPDLGTTCLLMQNDRKLSGLIAEEIQKWKPTAALIPTMLDAHPDHSALAVAFALALDMVGDSPIPAWEYLVHKPQIPIPQEPVKVILNSDEVERKRRAILCHETQVALSRGRFTSFAKVEEAYYAHDPVEAKKYEEPLAAAHLDEGVLSFQFQVSWRERFHSEILFAFKSGIGNEYRWRLAVPFRSGNAQIWDTISNRRLNDANVQWTGSRLSVDIPVPILPDFKAIYAKHSGRTLFFDRSGWSRFTEPARREENLVGRAQVPGLGHRLTSGRHAAVGDLAEFQGASDEHTEIRT